ncbi:MAG: 30S ribosomal protein S19e [Candidatus Thermoplasmatota archaeon]
MTTVYDVPPQKLIERLAELFKADEQLAPPEWAQFVKTGRHREKAPTDADWWYKRLAAVLRKVYLLGPIGSDRLAAEFGGSADRGSKPNVAKKGSRAIVRRVLRQLEVRGYLTIEKRRGRAVSPEGRRLLDNTAHAIFKEMVESNPHLKKYA